MTIDWMTVVFEVINFALLVLIALRFIFRPVRAILEQRQAEIVARARATAEREAEAEAVRARYEGELAAIDRIAEQRVNAALGEARAEAETIIEDARATARGELDKGEAELAGARRRALEQFRGEIMRLGTEAARRVVRELDSPELGLAFARRAVHALDDAIDSHRPLGVVDVRHSPDVDPDALASLVRAQLGAEVELRVRLDEDLIAGVCLTAQGHEVEASAGFSLDGWYRSLIGATG